MRWLEVAERIPDASLRHTSLGSLGKRGNIEGAALFASLAPARHRRQAMRAQVAFQTLYNHLDALSEQPCDEPVCNGDQLHQALLVALLPGAPHTDYYAHSRAREDGGYVVELVEACRRELSMLPAYSTVAPLAREAAARIVDFQALNLNQADGGHAALERWAREVTPAASGLRWWETAAAGGSSLAVHALISAAASPATTAADARAIAAVYYPWAGALHTLLDSLVDRAEDDGAGRPCLLDCYGSSAEAATSLAVLAQQTLAASERLPDALIHRVVLTAMCSYYLSAPECVTTEGHAVARALEPVLGVSLFAAVLAFRAKRRAHVLAGALYT